MTTFDSPVSPAGSASYVPDTFETDGLSGLLLGPGAVTNAGTLRRLKTLNVERVSPPDSRRLKSAVVAYNFSLIGTSLQKAARSWCSELSRGLKRTALPATGGNPLNLAPYWWDGVNWRVLARPQIDTTLHTVTAYLPPPAPGSIGKAVVALDHKPRPLRN